MGAPTGHQGTSHRDGPQWERYPGHNTRAENKHEHGDEYAKKKADKVVAVNPAYVHTGATLRIRLEADEQWSYVQNKRNPRWL